MSTGKAASQAGHAFLDAFLRAIPDITQKYRDDGEGTKIVLRAANEAELRRVYDDAVALGLPAALVTESGHVMPPHFDGEPIITAVGIGPCLRAQAKPVTKKLRLMN